MMANGIIRYDGTLRAMRVRQICWGWRKGHHVQGKGLRASFCRFGCLGLRIFCVEISSYRVAF